MKRYACILIIMLIFPYVALADEIPSITYEQLISGEYYGQIVEVNAKAVPIARYYNLTHLWSVEKSDGTFEIVDNSDTRWCISEEDYQQATEEEQKAIDQRETLVLNLHLRSDGRPTIRDFRLPGAMSYDDKMTYLQIGLMVILVICVIVLVIAVRMIAKNPPKKPPEPIKTKFIDSSHTVTSQVSTSSAVGRAVIGGMIAGSVGAVIGAGTAKQNTYEKNTTTFMVYYDDGSRKVETVSNNSYIYKKYMNLLELD